MFKNISKYKTKSNIISLIFISAFFILIYVLNTTLVYSKPADRPVGIKYERAEVVSIISETLEPDPDFQYINIGKQEVELKILKGENKGKIVKAINFVGRVDNRPVSVGTKLVISSYDDFITTVIVNYNRETAIYILLLIFMAVVIIFGRSKGVKSLLSLIFTMITVIFVFIPLIIKGVNPIMASIIIVILSTIVTLVSLNGLSIKTMVASFSCILCTVISGVIAYIFGVITNISTYNTAEVQDLLFVATNTSLNIKNLLFSGILISSLGAIMDTSMSITSTLFEMKDVNSNLNTGQLIRSGLNIGRDIMGTMTNTLILAFTGSSINIIIIYFMYNLPYIQLINIDLIVIEIVQGLSGGIAVILSIPITTFLAAEFSSNKRSIKNIRNNLIINKLSEKEG